MSVKVSLQCTVAFHTHTHPVKHLKDAVFDIFQGFKWLYPSQKVVYSKLKLRVLSKAHRFDHIIQGLGKNGYCGIIHGLT
jgi:hypothetical protein